MFHPNVVPGVHRVEDTYVNWYLIEEGGQLTIVDAGLPNSWVSLQRALAELGRTPSDVSALILTHSHFDHVGFAERARREMDIPVWAHELELPLTQHPLSYQHEKSRLKYAWKPANMKVMASFIANGMLWVPPISNVRTFHSGDTLDVPGRPQVVFTPGHTFGHCSFHLPRLNVLIAGDAIVTYDPYTGGTGPQIVAQAATANSDQAMDSLDQIAATGADVLLTGHGEPWMGGAAAAVDHARLVSVH